jgi:hypothetical protein
MATTRTVLRRAALIECMAACPRTSSDRGLLLLASYGYGMLCCPRPKRKRLGQRRRWLAKIPLQATADARSRRAGRV